MLVHVALFVATVCTTTMSGAIVAGAPPWEWRAGVPFSSSLLSILLAHEFGHYFACRRHGMQASLPYLLPGIPLPPAPGTFGAVIRVRSRFPHRAALFDVGAAGPWAGFVVAVPILIAGLSWSRVEPLPDGAGILFGDSILTGALTRWITGGDPASVLVHPVALAAWFGLFITSLNLIPVGQLDGGHILYAALGRRPSPILVGLLIPVLLWLGSHHWEGWFLCALILTIMAFMGHPPTLADDVPLDGRRRLAALASLILFGLTFIPEPLRVLPGGLP
jgi:membrane-associated protease RseP (regulator of RpoE activity)